MLLKIVFAVLLVCGVFLVACSGTNETVSDSEDEWIIGPPAVEGQASAEAVVCENFANREISFLETEDGKLVIKITGYTGMTAAANDLIEYIKKNYRNPEEK